MQFDDSTCRLDVLVSEKAKIGRELAKELIVKGLVSINGKVVYKAGQKYAKNADIEINMPKDKFVSRGGYKLDKAINVFNIDVKNKVCIDVGASTGGFTDCLLQRGASVVYAIDSGTEQLAESLKSDTRVISMEQTNIRNVDKESFRSLADIIVVDVSFISLTKVLSSVFSLLKDDGVCVCLVKPQFESEGKKLNKQGVVKDKRVHLKVLQKVQNYAIDTGFSVDGLESSPIDGRSGNKEYLLYISKVKDQL